MAATLSQLAQLDAARNTAGARYAAAVAELHASLVDLAALDRIANNSLVTTRGQVPTFVDPPDSLPWPFCHPTYALRTPLPNWRDQIGTSYAAYTSGAGAYVPLFPA